MSNEWKDRVIRGGGVREGANPSTTLAGSPDSAWSYRQWPQAIMAMTSTDELRSDPNPVN